MEVVISCLCGTSRQTVQLEASALPADSFLCHCRGCRSNSGVLCTCYLPLASAPKLAATLSSYKPSPNLVRYFCRSCGSHTFVFSELAARFSVCSGVVEHRGNVVSVKKHKHVADTIDGGVSIYIRKISGEDIPAFAGDGDQQLRALVCPTNATQVKTGVSGSRLYARCHCGKVEYFVTRPNENSTNFSAPWPDLLVPFHSRSPKNLYDEKWWLQANSSKYLAGLCTCRSCRLASGFPIQAWAFIPKSNIFWKDLSTLSFNIEELAVYESSPGIFREFCATCGATVFWHCEERPHLIDVSVGLLNSDCGARAEDWLEWATGRVSFKEEAQDQVLASALEVGLQSLACTSGQPSRDISKEASAGKLKVDQNSHQQQGSAWLPPF